MVSNDLPATRREPRGRVVHERILASARRLFASRGFDGVSMEAIADAANVTRRTVYNKFADKADLYRSVFAPLVASLSARAGSAVLGKGMMSPQAPLAQAAFAIFEDRDYLELLGVAIRDSKSQPWLADAYRMEVQLSLRHSLEKALESDDRRISPGLGSNEAASTCLLGLFNGIIALPRLLGSADETGRDVETLKSLAGNIIDSNLHAA